MDEIRMAQYSNLRANFNSLVKYTLGDNYYNMAMDVYQSDIDCCDDIKMKFDIIKRETKIYKIAFWITLSILFTVVGILMIK